MPRHAKRDSPFGRLPETKPTTGNGWTGGQKPKLSQTNLGKPKPTKIRVPRWLGGK